MGMVGRIVEIAVRYRTLFAIAAGVWFWTGCAVYAGFLQLPEIPQWAKDGYFWSSVAANALWWAYLNPKVEERRKEPGELPAD